MSDTSGNSRSSPGNFSAACARVARPAAAAAVSAVFLVGPAVSAHAGNLIDLAAVQLAEVTGSAPGDRLGFSLATGDVDGDGRDEVAAGAPGHVPAQELEETGAVFVFDVEALAAGTAPISADSTAAMVILGTHPHEGFGESVLVDDLDGDGRPDLVVGAPGWGTDEEIQSGRIYVFLGPLTPEHVPVFAAGADLVLRGSRPGDRLGASLVSGDVDGDGIAELLVSAPRAVNGQGARAGSVYVLSVDALAEEPHGTPAALACDLEFQGEAEGDAVRGMAVLPGGEEGSPAVALGAYHADAAEKRIDAGKVYVLEVREASGSVVPLADSGAAVVLGPHPRSFLGRSIATGDVDGDGDDDLALSAYASRGERSKADASGEVYLLYGRPEAGSVTDLSDEDEETPTFRSSERWDLFGLPVLIRDVNGDGRADLVVSAQFADSEDGDRRRCGEVYVFRGGPRSVIGAKVGEADGADVTVVGARPFDAIGSSLATATASARYPDLVIGCPDSGGHEGSEAPGAIFVVPSELLTGY